MRSLKNYTPKSTPEKSENGNEALTASELTKRLASAWNGKNSREMLAEILAEAEKSKRQGTLTNEEIDEFYKQFSTFLSASEKRMLSSVVEKLKRI